MFRDKDEALARLEEELLEEDAPQEEVPEEEEEEYEELDVPIYNADRADLDLEAFSQEVYDPTTGKRSRALVWLFFLLCGIFCVLAWYILRYKGVI